MFSERVFVVINPYFGNKVIINFWKCYSVLHYRNLKSCLPFLPTHFKVTFVYLYCKFFHLDRCFFLVLWTVCFQCMVPITLLADNAEVVFW